MTEKEFVKTYCRPCGSQRCAGPGDEMAEGCPHYRKIILNKAQLPNYTQFIEEALKKYMEATFYESQASC